MELFNYSNNNTLFSIYCILYDKTRWIVQLISKDACYTNVCEYNIHIYIYTVYLIMQQWSCDTAAIDRATCIVFLSLCVAIKTKENINIVSNLLYCIIIFKLIKLIKRIYHKNKLIINLLMHTRTCVCKRTYLLYRSVSHKALGL